MQTRMPKFQGQYFVSPAFKASRYRQLNQTLSDKQHLYADELSISIHPQNGWYKEGSISYRDPASGNYVTRSFSLRKIPLFDCLPVPVGPELETANHFAKRLIQEARKMTQELGFKRPNPPKKKPRFLWTS